MSPSKVIKENKASLTNKMSHHQQHNSILKLLLPSGTTGYSDPALHILQNTGSKKWITFTCSNRSQYYANLKSLKQHMMQIPAKWILILPFFFFFFVFAPQGYSTEFLVLDRRNSSSVSSSAGRTGSCTQHHCCFWSSKKVVQWELDFLLITHVWMCIYLHTGISFHVHFHTSTSADKEILPGTWKFLPGKVIRIFTSLGEANPS